MKRMYTETVGVRGSAEQEFHFTWADTVVVALGFMFILALCAITSHYIRGK